MNKYRFLFDRSIVVLMVLLSLGACTDDKDGYGVGEDADLVFTKPNLQWGISKSSIDEQMKAEDFVLVDDESFYCVYEGKLLEKRISYMFQSGRLCATSIVIPYDSIQSLNEITAAFPGATPVEGYADTYLDVRNNFMVDYKVKDVTNAIDEKDNGKYWIVSWTQYDADVAQAVDLGLSVNWADVNLVLRQNYSAATNPEYAGSIFTDRYGWGDPMGGKMSTEVSDYPNLLNISGTEYDIASVNWGSNWRLPTQKEMQELVDQCTWTWTKRNDVDGYNIEGPSGKSIFLPISGYRFGSGRGIETDNGYYWTGTLTPDNTDYPYVLTFGSSFKGLNVDMNILRSYGCAIRPVQDK